MRRRRNRLSKLAKKKLDVCSTYWRNQADRAWSKAIHARDKACLVCNSTRFTQAHHLISSSIHCLRHCLMNGILLCVKHHKYDARLSAHKGSAMFGVWFREHRPEQLAWVQQHWEDDNEPDYKRALKLIKEANV